MSYIPLQYLCVYLPLTNKQLMFISAKVMVKSHAFFLNAFVSRIYQFRVGESSDSDSDSGGRGGRGSRGRRGKSGRMYPTPAEKKRAHLQALQQMKQNEQTKIADKVSSYANIYRIV